MLPVPPLVRYRLELFPRVRLYLSSTAIILSGQGMFQVDDEVFAIGEGSVVRVATNCDRNLKCTSAEPMTYICIQAKEGSLDTYTMTDAEITERENRL